MVFNQCHLPFENVGTALLIPVCKEKCKGLDLAISLVA